MSSSTSEKVCGLLGKVLDIESESGGSRIAAAYFDYETETTSRP